MGTRKGRGRSAATLFLIEAMIEIAREIQPCSVRALAYQLFIRKLIESMAVKYTKRVSELSVIAREEGQMPWEWITDRTRAEQRVATWADPLAYIRTVQHSYRREKWADQPTHISVWSEKSTIEGTIRPVLEHYEVPFRFLQGFSGAGTVKDDAQANLNGNQRTLLLYVGDYDPSGMHMSEVDLVKRFARYSSNAPNEDIDLDLARRCLAEINLEVRRIALTKQDTIDLGEATRFPASDKKLDTRYKWFVQNYGHWCWELDALSPAVLRNRLEQAIVAELDLEIWERYVRVEQAEREAIFDLMQAWGSISGQVPKYSDGQNTIDGKQGGPADR